MKITEAKIRLLSVDSRPYYQHVGGLTPISRTSWEYPLVELTTDEGFKGYATGYAPRGEGRGLAQVLHDCYVTEVIGLDLVDHAQWWHRMMARQRHIYGLTEGLVGVMDVALWDLQGKAANRPIVEMLGVRRRKAATYQTRPTGRMSLSQIASDVVEVKKSGITAYKLQHADPANACIEKLSVAREAAGDAYPLMYDAIAAYDLCDAQMIGRGVDRLNYTWFEEPIPDRSWRLLRELSSKLTTPIHHAETLSLAETAQIVIAGVGQAVRGDVHIKAGITGMRKLIGMCELAGMRLEFHTAASFLLDIANVHVMCSTALGDFFEVHSPEVSSGMKGNPLTPDAQGFVHCPTKPGLGVELDWDWIENHTIATIT